jgi:serine protease Do
MKRLTYTLSGLLILVSGYVIGAAPPDQATPLITPKPVELSNTFSTLAKKLEPSVVTITSTVGQTRRRASAGGEEAENNDEDMLRRFFGGGGTAPRQNRGFQMGSGVIVDPKGYILTNQHVINKAERIQVKVFDDPTEYEAKLVGSDKESDLAVIRIEADRKFAFASIGNSDAVQVGEWAIAIGAPFGFDRSVTAGIISAKGRDLGDREHPLPRFLQTDAAINQGNSGGPLINIRGEVIGINSAIESQSGGFEGLGFAIPINMAAKVYNDIIRSGKVTRGAIGISFNTRAKPELLKAYGADAGVFVEQVTPGGPAEKAGIKPGDVITAFQKQPVKNGDDMLSKVQDVPVGAKCDVTVLREGKKLDVELEIADRAELNAALEAGARQAGPRRRETAPEAESAPVRFGLSVQELTSDARQELNFSGKTGILVTSVEAGSFAEDIGLRQGDILTHMNRQQLQSIADLKRLQSTLKPGDAVAFRALRNASQQGEDWQAFFPAGTVPNK